MHILTTVLENSFPIYKDVICLWQNIESNLCKYKDESENHSKSHHPEITQLNNVVHVSRHLSKHNTHTQTHTHPHTHTHLHPDFLPPVSFTIVYPTCFNRYFFFSNFFGCHMQLAGSQFLDQGSNPGPQQWKHRVLTTGPPGNSRDIFNILIKIKTVIKVLSYQCSF